MYGFGEPVSVVLEFGFGEVRIYVLSLGDGGSGKVIFLFGVVGGLIKKLHNEDEL